MSEYWLSGARKTPTRSAPGGTFRLNRLCETRSTATYSCVLSLRAYAQPSTSASGVPCGSTSVPSIRAAAGCRTKLSVFVMSSLVEICCSAPLSR